MSAFAVIKSGGKQHRVSPDDVIVVEKLDGAAGDAVSFDDVLMLSVGDDVKIGDPIVSGQSVTGEIVEQRRADKILIIKKRRRSTYRRTQGHRQPETVVRITGVGGAKAKAAPAKKAAAAPKAEPKSAAPAKAAPKAAAPAGDDDLKMLTGVGPALETKLKDAGVTSFAQIAAWTDADIANLEETISGLAGKVEKGDWLANAAKLAKGEE